MNMKEYRISKKAKVIVALFSIVLIAGILYLSINAFNSFNVVDKVIYCIFAFAFILVLVWANIYLYILHYILDENGITMVTGRGRITIIWDDIISIERNTYERYSKLFRRFLRFFNHKNAFLLRGTYAKIEIDCIKEPYEMINSIMATCQQKGKDIKFDTNILYKCEEYPRK